MAHRLKRLRWLNASPLRAGIEALLLGVVLVALTWTTYHHLTVGERQNSLFVALLTGMSWYGIRLQQGRGGLGQRLGFEIVCVLPPALLIGALIGLLGSWLLPGVKSVPDEPGLLAIVGSILRLFDLVLIQGKPLPTNAEIPNLVSPPPTVIMSLSGSIAVLVSRGMMLGWQFWARLRRRHLIWALTHSHLMLVVLGVFLFAAAQTIHTLDYLTSKPEESNLLFSVILNLIPLIIVIVFMMLLLLFIVLPPALVLAYIAAHRTTRRLQLLTHATTRLRQGDYTVRVSIQGEDEVAALQANFNAMAQDLERAIHDVQTERDHVEKLLRSRRELIASVSHELRTPVAVLYSYLESTQSHWQAQLPDDLKRDFATMESETKQLQRLLDDLFTLSRAEVGELAINCHPALLQGIVQHAASAAAPMIWQTAKVELVTDIPADLPLVLVDETRLEQILHNLLRNSARHTPPGGIIAITASVDQAHVIVRVQDTGEGITPEHLPHIWERFYRVDPGSDQSRTGLGLALVKELTEAMGGQVAVTSTPGEGSTFSISLVRAQPG